MAKNYFGVMGLSIHYSGRIKDNACIQSLMEEVRDVCTILEWEFHLVDDDNFKGIFFTPPGSETLSLTFLHDGQLVSAIMLEYGIHPATTISVKTQYAGMEVHIAVIKLLKHLSQQYFSVFGLSDEGGYWESNDEEVLHKQFAVYNNLLNEMQTALMDFKAEKNETAATLADRMEKFLKDRWKE